MTSPDLTDANVDKLSELFPSVITEAVDTEGNAKRVIDFDLLRQEFADYVVEGPQERYQLDWPGKREAVFAANAPIAKTLRPLRDDSVEFETTKNLFIEGDNLEALKLLQESYLGKVKLVYIDPPYNTGSDLVYHDDFAENAEDYLTRSSQVSDLGERLVANTETNGRFHSDWLTFIYPRLKLARRILTDDGVILISIDDGEQASLRRICDEIFGEANFVAQLVWEKGRKNDAKFFSIGHEYVLVYAKSKPLLRERGTEWREEKPGAREIWDEYLRLREVHREDNQAIEKDISQWFAGLSKSEPAKKWARYRRIDEFGPWRDRDISWPGGDGPRYEVIHPVTGQACKIPDAGWRFTDPAEMQRQIKLGLVVFREDHTEPPFRKAHLRPIPGEGVDASNDEESEESELANQVRGSYFYKQSQVAVKHLRSLMGAKVFNNPKDHVELSRLFEYVLDGAEGIVMDFFAGSASTAEAVFEMGARTGQNCPLILVQLPEDLEANRITATGSSKTTISNAIKYLQGLGKPAVISELTKIRINAAGERVVAGKCHKLWNQDVGFRSLRVATTNMANVLRTPDETGQQALTELESSVKPGRSGEDLLFQVLLDWGLELTMHMTIEKLENHEVFVVDDDALIACFDTTVSPELVRAIAKREPLRAVFRDSGFASDAARINAEQVFREISPSTEVKAV
ncbi:site-specific DNA-methyltransferase [Mycolicibacterium sp. F2034L]|uniref:site-specific DNA-methyltransferase n=1 Tax=Mycolicibacterium sp. F2034L TaxID=2926422 RepID=UPI001FF58CF8|nr:site-specific DNA-methyltransferase [Mycolicibacterium sp. F2034L]MCK0175849.1 site-specific DNA-methyltransferase [Mycolicibacterium sp. F2034L]